MSDEMNRLIYIIYQTAPFSPLRVFMLAAFKGTLNKRFPTSNAAMNLKLSLPVRIHDRMGPQHIPAARIKGDKLGGLQGLA